MKVVLFGGSFDPVHLEHVRLVRAALFALKADKAIVIPSCVAPHKTYGAVCSGEDRLRMCRIAFRNEPDVEVSDFELTKKGTSYTYLTCEHFAQEYAGAELFFLVGADMLEDFFGWKNPEIILSHVTVAACGRGEACAAALHEKFHARFGCDFVKIPFTGEEISSTRLRCELAFGKTPSALDKEVYAYIRGRGLYTFPAVEPALALEKSERREHSFRVALLAAECAPRYKISQSKAILAAALHDCGKYVPLSSPLLEGFTAPPDVPAPVLHQYTGAYLAEHLFGVDDEEVLDAIRYHTSGREDMTPLGKLIFLADMLEEGRTFEGVAELREALKRDLDECLLRCFEQQYKYLKTNEANGNRIYSLTERSYEWLKRHKNGNI